MPFKLKGPKLNGAQSPGAVGPPPSSDRASPRPKLNPPFKPSIPAIEQPPPAAAAAASTKKPTQRKPTDSGSKKRPADETISPAAKRPNPGPSTQPERKPSGLKLKLGGPKIKPEQQQQQQDELAQPSPSTAPTPKLSLKKARPAAPSAPKRVTLNVKREPPPRPKAVGYDSEDSDVERDPMIEQAFILRMQEGEDCDLLHKAIEEKTLGVPTHEGGTDVRLRFLDKEHRRATVTIKGRMYGAALVDLPCVIESMKSWDKKGWWKVVDICQMLLVLGRCGDDEEAKKLPLPAGDVEEGTFKYKHGLAPPFHDVRRRRFRKRVVHRPVEAVDEEVERLLADDEEAEASGGKTSFEMIDPNAPDDDADANGDYDDDADAPGEDEYYDEPDDEDAHKNLEADMLDAFMNEDDNDAEDADADATAATPADDVTEPVSANTAARPAPKATLATTSIFTTSSLVDSPAASTSTPAAHASSPSDEAAASPFPPSHHSDSSSDASSSDEDDDDDDDNPAPPTEEQLAAQKLAEQQAADLSDLREEVARAKLLYLRQTNQMLIRQKMKAWRQLREQLRVKCESFGAPFPEGEEEEEEGVGV